MEDEVLLCIGNNKMLMSPEEAFRICEVINGSTRIGSQWCSKAGKDGKGGSLDLLMPPDSSSFVAYVVPMTGHMRLTLGANERLFNEDKK